MNKNRTPMGVRHEHVQYDKRHCMKWSCRWNPSHCTGPDGYEVVLVTSIYFGCRQDHKPAPICNCNGFYFSQHKNGIGHCYHVDKLLDAILQIHWRELAQIESAIAHAQGRYKMAREGSMSGDYKENKLKTEQNLLEAITESKRYLSNHTYLIAHIDETQDFPHITKHTELMRREYHGQK